jgi:hypothetical protein
MKEFINTEYYGNTVSNWIIAKAIIIVSILFARVAFYLLDTMLCGGDFRL